jgi:hypothetical protein
MKKLIKKLKRLALAAFGLKNVVGYHGWLEIRNPLTGRLLQKVDNLIVNGGLAQAAYLLVAGGAEPLSLGCIGTGVAAANVADSSLGTQVDSVAVTASRTQTSVANDTAQFVSLHTAGVGGWAVTEYGIKTAGGVLFNRVVFAAISLAQGNQLEFTYKVQVTAV